MNKIYRISTDVQLYFTDEFYLGKDSVVSGLEEPSRFSICITGLEII